MKLPEPVAHMLNGGAAFEMGQEPYHVGPEWDALFTEAQLREALASHESVMRQALLAIRAVGLSGTATKKARDTAIKALEDALK